MRKIHHAKISKIGNPWGIRLPKEMVLALGTMDVVPEETTEGILIKPTSFVVPLSEWDEMFAKAKVSNEAKFKEWDVTLSDGCRNKHFPIFE